MKRHAGLVLVAILLLPVLALGCQGGSQPAVTLELTYDDFTAQTHITKDVEITRPGSLIMTLYSNPSTGFGWGESANVTPAGIIEQVSHNFVTPQSSGDIVGAGGKDVWVFDSKEAGSTTINFAYSRPWEGGEQNIWTVTLNVTVK